jgi:hypothetical protein
MRPVVDFVFTFSIPVPLYVSINVFEVIAAVRSSSLYSLEDPVVCLFVTEVLYFSVFVCFVN